VRLPKELSFGPQVESEGVGALHLWGDGIALLSATTKQLWAAVGLSDPRATRMAAIPGVTAGSPAVTSAAAPTASPPSAGGVTNDVTSAQLAVLRPEDSVSRCLEVLVAVGDKIWLVDERSANDHALPPGAGGGAALAVAPGGAFVAVFCNDGRLRVFASGEFFQGGCLGDD